MSRSLPTRTLRANPDLDQLKRQAKELLAAFRNGQPDATAEVRAHYRGADPSPFDLHHAQLVMARAYGFDSWARLKAYVDGVTVTRLAEAVRARDVDTATAMLAARPELVHMDMSEHNEHRVLHYAVLNGDARMVRLLMEHDADPYKGIWPHRDATGALTMAADRGDDEIVAIITEVQQRRRLEGPGGAAAPLPRIDRSSPIIARVWAAAAANDEAAVIACLEEEPRLVHWHQGDGWTPLHQASLMLHVDVARWLIAHGADVNAYEPRLWTPLELAGVYRRNYTPEKAAAMIGLLTSHGAKMTGGAAVMHQDAAWLRARHAEGALTDPPGAYGLVTKAVIRNRPAMLTLLLDLGFDPDARRRLDGLEEVVYSWGEPLRECAACDRLDLAEILLQRGADPNPSIYAGSSPLFEAYQHDRRDMIALLERYGAVADAGIIGYFGLIDRARQMLADEAAGRLLQRSGVGEGTTVAAALLVSGADGGQVEIVRLALEHLDWPAGDDRWHWNLMRPLGAHKVEERDRYLTCFRLMVERAGANAPARYGRSILHDVCGGWPRETSTAGERIALATILLDAGARLQHRDDLLRSTPLGWACRWGRAELVDLFLTRGADPIESDAESWATPRAWAARMGHADIVARLGAATS